MWLFEGDLRSYSGDQHHWLVGISLFDDASLRLTIK